MYKVTYFDINVYTFLFKINTMNWYFMGGLMLYSALRFVCADVMNQPTPKLIYKSICHKEKLTT